MKRKIISLCAMSMVSICLFSCLSKMSETVSEPNSGINGSFELVQNEIPVNWLIYTAKTSGEGNYKIYADTDNPVSGKYCLSMDIKNCSDKGGRFSPGIASEIPVKEGEHYKISLQLNNHGVNCKIKISGVNATQGNDGPLIENRENTQGWSRITTEYQIPKKMNRLRIEISALSEGKVSVDDVKIEKIEN
jgi:hypothetical protein